MEHAKCKLCGHRHSGLEHIWSEDNPPVEKIKKTTDKITKVLKERFDRTAYQREYMRKRRAKK